MPFIVNVGDVVVWGLLPKKNHISPGQDDVLMGKDKGMKMKMIDR